MTLPGLSRVYNVTEGLTELLTNTDPDDNLITVSDRWAYTDILRKTNSYKKKYSKNAPANYTQMKNYLEYIRPWALKKKNKGGRTASAASPPPPPPPFAQGSSGLLRKVVTNVPVEYVYFNNPAELLDRLVLIWGEIRSGNTNPNLQNELVNILQEFKEEEWHFRR